MRMNDRLVWIDCEMTGLELGHDRLIEIACVVTDAELQLLDEGIDLVISAPDEALDQMLEVVVCEMHAASGLTPRRFAPPLCRSKRPSSRFSTTSGQPRPERRKAPLCGNSIATDRAFLARDMPTLDDWLALPHDRRVVDQGAVARSVPAGLFRRPGEARWSPRPCRHQGERPGAALLPGGDFRTPSPARTRRPRGRSRRGTPERVRQALRARDARGTPETAILVFSRAMSLRAARVLLWPGRMAGRRWWA